MAGSALAGSALAHGAARISRLSGYTQQSPMKSEEEGEGPGSAAAASLLSAAASMAVGGGALGRPGVQTHCRGQIVAVIH